jgi:uncharacterized protein YbaP (TraB family)
MERYMKKNSVLMGISAAFLLFSCASLPDTSKSSVWEISKNGNTLLLGGSIHLLREDDFPLPPEFEAAFDRSDVLVLEADVDKMADPAVQAYLLQQLLLPEGVTLDAMLSEDVYHSLEAEFKALGVPSLDAFSQFKPGFVASVATLLTMQQLGFSGEGVDAYFLSKAKAAGKTTAFLEDVEAQIDMIAREGEGYEDDYVRYSLADLANTGTFLNTLVSEWRRGEGSFTESVLEEMKGEWPASYQAMILKRNSAWLPAIDSFLDTKPVEFVIGGLAHLHGPDGLLRQLQEKGYTVRPFVR